ncbi:hypothetical protein COJ46_23210 [Bacillus sp. AFS077874]|nr:hypothetical protein CON00_12450 [Bacillus sp. AFS096315]PFM74736.1 hypothetical protein COJ46_23210 [Bacillus sp. AFS077874]
MTENPKNFSLVKAIIKMGHSLGFKFAEGVETEDQMKMLKNLNCDVGQGYYFNRPLPLEEICLSKEIGIN